MARKSSSAAVQDELYPLPEESTGRDAFDGARLMDLEAEQESPFLRAQKRVPARRGSLPTKTVHWLKWIALAVLIAGVVGSAASAIYGYGKHSWRFRIDSSDQIEISGGEHVTHGQILEVMGGDIGRNIFFVPLAQRRLQLEQISWVESASVMRFVPNRLSVRIQERTPVAFARIGSHISLIDAGGTLMELAPGGKHKYSFPVIAGMNSGEPLSMRMARMKNYNELLRQLDSGGVRYSQELSEVDLSDADDVKVVVADPSGDVLVHLGSGNYLARYRVYVSHVQQWRQQFEKLESVDLRYDGQIIVNPDLQGMPRQPVLTPAVAKAAMAAGAKPAAIVNYEKYVTHPAALPPKKPAKAVKSKPQPAKKPPVTVARTAAPIPHAAATAAGATPANGAAARPASTPSASRTSTTTVVPPPAPPTSKKPSAGIPKESTAN